MNLNIVKMAREAGFHVGDQFAAGCSEDDLRKLAVIITRELKELEQTNQKPVAWRWGVPKLKNNVFEWRYSLNKTKPESIPLYAFPPKFLTLTNDDCIKLEKTIAVNKHQIRAIESAILEKQK